MPKTLLVTGASGFVASHFIPCARRRGYRIRALVRKSTSSEKLGALAKHNCEIVYAGTLKELQRACEGIYGIVNLIGVLHEDGAKARSYARTNNVLKHLLHAAEKEKVKQFVHLSALVKGSSAYAICKRQGEELIKKSNVRYTILRPSLILGPGSEFMNRLRSAITLLPRVPVMGPSQVQPIDVKNVVTYIIKSLEHKISANAIFDIAGPDSVSFEELVILTGRKLHKPVKTLRIPVSLMKLPLKIVDILMAHPPLSTNELQLFRQQKIYAQKAAHQLGVTLTPLSDLIEGAL